MAEFAILVIAVSRVVLFISPHFFGLHVRFLKPDLHAVLVSGALKSRTPLLLHGYVVVHDREILLQPLRAAPIPMAP